MWLMRLIFAALTAWGIVLGHWGGAAIALAFYLLAVYADRHFRKQDQLWAADPRNAQPLHPPTAEELQRHQAEGQ